MDHWYKARHYLHFDRPINKESAVDFVSSADRITRHAFYPLIRYEAVSKKTFFDKTKGCVDKKEKIRPISYAAHLDSHIYSYFSKKLSDSYESFIKDKPWGSSVLAFRSLGESNIQFALRAFNEIRVREECCVIALDIKGFFDNLDHVVLKEAWCQVLGQAKLPDEHYSVYRSLTKFSYVELGALYDSLGIPKNNPKNGRTRVCEPHEFRNIVRKKKLIKTNLDNFGIPQGTPISATLSNIYMLDFDKALNGFVQSCNGAYFRYCDDILIVVPTNKKTEAECFSENEIKKIKLSIQKDKTIICFFKNNKRIIKPLQYLGFTFDGLNIHIRSSSLMRYHERVNSGISTSAKRMAKINNIRINRSELPKPLYLKKIHDRYSHLGRRNFISYGYRAARIMDSKSIRKQLKPYWNKLREKISKV